MNRRSARPGRIGSCDRSYIFHIFTSMPYLRISVERVLYLLWRAMGFMGVGSILELILSVKRRSWLFSSKKSLPN